MGGLGTRISDSEGGTYAPDPLLRQGGALLALDGAFTRQAIDSGLEVEHNIGN